MELIDSHVHFDDPRFDEDRQQIYQRARDVGIQQMVMAATTAARWPILQAVSEMFPGVHPSYGLHPWFCQDHTDQHLNALNEWVRKPQCVALGECGLDFFLPDTDKAKQYHLFTDQLAIARRERKPVIIHARKAVEETLNLLKSHPISGGVMHSYSGSLQQAHRLIDLGCYIGISATVTHTRAQKMHKLVKQLPLDALLIETDAPDQPGAQHRQQRNEPAYLVEVLESVALHRQESKEVIAAATASNAKRLFGLP